MYTLSFKQLQLATFCIFCLNTGFAFPVQVYDYGLGLKICSYSLPSDWSVKSNITSSKNSMTEFFSSYQLDFLSEYGEVAHNFSPIHFCPYLGESVEMIWHRTMVEHLSEFGVFHGGELTQSNYGNYVFPNLKNIPGVEVIESYVYGTRHGQEFEGVCIGILAYGEYASSMTGVVILSPKGYLSQTVQTYYQILQSKTENPDWRNQFDRLCNKKRAQYVNYTNQIMANREQQYDSWRTANQDLANAYSKYNSSFNKYIGGRSNSSGSEYGDYTSQDAYNDHIQSATSFDDPYLGYRVKVDGEFDYWFTDGYGNYYGTNDSSFDPYTLGGNWTRTYPVN